MGCPFTAENPLFTGFWEHHDSPTPVLPLISVHVLLAARLGLTRRSGGVYLGGGAAFSLSRRWGSVAKVTVLQVVETVRSRAKISDIF